MEIFKKKHKRVLTYLIILYSVFVIGISILGVKYYNGQKDKLKSEFEKQLITISDLKVGEILQWREERLQDAKTFYKNTSLAGHIKDYFGNKEAASKEKIETWLGKVQNTKDVETVFLLDSQMKKIIAVPKNSEMSKSFISPSNYDSIKSGRIVFEDFLRCKETQKIYLKIFVPIFDVKDTSRFIGAVVIRINPYVYLYSLINRWPVPNKTAETLILKREGDEIVFLNELKFHKNSALNLRFPITTKDLPAVKAALGESGIVEGTDYKGNEVIADVRTIPNSPWFMVTRMDKSEIYEPMLGIFLYIVFTITGIFFIVGLILFIFWREVKNRFYQEQYKSSEVLRESEERFRLLFDEAPLGYQALDFDGNFIDVNQKWIDTLGYERDEVIGKWFGDFLAPDYKEVFRERFPIFKARGEIHSEFEMLHKTGKHLFISFDGKIGNNIDGTFKQTHCTLKDITEQRRAEAEQKRLWNIISSSLNEIYIFDTNKFKFEYINKGALQNLGFTFDELKYMTPLDIKPKITETEFKEITAPLLNHEKEVIIFETVHERKDGSLYDVEVHLQLVPYNSDEVFIAFIMDITERKRTEEKKRESEEKFRLVFDNSIIGKSITGLDGSLQVNQAFCNMLGYTKEELQNIKWMDLTHPEDIQENKDNVDSILNGEMDSMRWEKRYLHKNGSIVWADINTTLQRDKDGNPSFFITGLIDITERKRAEEALTRSEKELKKAQEITHIGSWYLDVESNQVVWSEELYKMYGFDPALPPPPYTEHQKLFTPESWEVLSYSLAKTRETGIPYEHELKTVREDGSNGWMWVRGETVQDKEGKTIALWGAAQDITERMQTEIELRKSKQNWEGIFHGLSHPTVILDAQHNVLEINESLREKLGKDSEGIKKLKCWEIFHEPETTCPPNGCPFEQMTLTGTAETTEMEMEAFGGFYLINCTPLFDDEGKLEKVIHIATDITDRRNAEREVLKLNRVYKVLSNVNQMIVRVKDVDEMLKDACSIAIQDGQFRMAWIGKVNKETNKVDVVALEGVTQDYLDNINIDLSDDVRSHGPTGSTTKTGKHFISNDIANDERMFPWREDAKRLEYKSSASFPIKVFGEVLYNLNLYSDELNFFDKDELALLDELVMDISFAIEFVEKEKARKKAESVLQEIISKNPMSIQIVDKKGYTLSTNSAHTELFGIAPPPDYSIFNDIQLEKQGFKDLFELVKKGEVVHFPDSYFNVHDVNPEFPDNPVWVRGVVFPLMDSNGNPERFVLMQDNITEQKKAEEAIRESERNYRELIDGMNETVWVIDFEGTLVDVNKRAVEVLGYSKEDLLSIGLYGIDTALKKEDIKTLAKNMPSDKLQIFETIHTTKDGKTIPVEVYSSLITYHGNKAILSIARDITERKRANDALKESEAKYRTLIETMPEGFYVSTPEGYFVDVNPAFVNMLGYDNKEELMKVNIPEELYFSKSDREVDVFNIDFTSDSEAYRLRKKDGSEIWVVDYGRYIKDDSGNIIFHEGIMRDITESLRAHNAIIEAKDKAEEMSRLKSSFLANMSHEIRTPLNGILGFAQLLQEEVKDDAQLKCVRVIEKSGNRLLETLDLILNFSKLEAEMVTAVFNELNVSDVIDEVVDSFEAMAKNKNLFIEKKIKYKNLVTKIDDRFLRHVLNNLVKNAIVYTNKGGITVTFDKDDNDIIFKVKDTGIGIAKENYEVIFEPFRQESEGWGRNFEGTGLGLSITKRFVEMMNGKIEVESEVGAGSTFTVRLPFTETDVTTAVKTGKKETSNKAPFAKTPVKKELCILLVENDEDNREFTMAVLDKYYKTDFAVDGYEAIEAAKGKVYDIILMDINLGKEIDGIMATQEIRKMKGYKDTPIVALTAYVREGDEEEFLAGGCTHFLGKPFTIKQLLDLIEEIIKHP